MVYRLISSKVDNSLEIDDLVSDAFERYAIWLSRGYRTETSLYALMGQIANSVASDYLRKRIRPSIRVIDEYDMIDDTDPTDKLHYEYVKDVILLLLKGMTLEQRCAIYVYYFSGNKIHQMTKLLTPSESLVLRQRHVRALATIRKNFHDYDESLARNCREGHGKETSLLTFDLIDTRYRYRGRNRRLAHNLYRNRIALLKRRLGTSRAVSSMDDEDANVDGAQRRANEAS